MISDILIAVRAEPSVLDYNKLPISNNVLDFTPKGP